MAYMYVYKGNKERSSLFFVRRSDSIPFLAGSRLMTPRGMAFERAITARLGGCGFDSRIIMRHSLFVLPLFYSLSLSLSKSRLTTTTTTTR